MGRIEYIITILSTCIDYPRPQAGSTPTIDTWVNYRKRIWSNGKKWTALKVEEIVSTNRNIGLIRGEMNPTELWESTMNPATRHLVQLLPENFEETSALFKILMGNNSTERKKFIMANALKYRLMDEDIYDVEEGEE